MNNLTAIVNTFSKWYDPIHGYASFFVCLLGITLNFFNIIVLTRRHMISSTNLILTALAITDFIAMLVYIPASLKFYYTFGNQDISNEKSLFWTIYIIFHSNVTVTMHSCSIWLTVLLAFFRYVYICHNKLGKTLCTRRNTIIAILCNFIFCVLLSLPSYMLSKIEKVEINETNLTNTTTTISYKIASSDIDVLTNGLLFQITFLLQAFLVKAIPCILIVILSSLLVFSIHKINRNNKKLWAMGGRKRDIEKTQEQARTNLMLVCVCVLFFIAEFPQGVAALLSFIFESTDFHTNVYMKIGDAMDLISLLNSALNFILYCLMSNTFRKTFKNIFCKCFIAKEERRRYPRKNSAFSATISKRNSSVIPLLQFKNGS